MEAKTEIVTLNLEFGFGLLNSCMKLREIDGLKYSEPQLPFAVRYLTTNGKHRLVLSLPVRPEVSKGERLDFISY
jgi:hypothetical protein